MKVRTRLTLLFTFLTATILFGFATVIYFSAKDTREEEFYILLEKEAVTKANLFLNAKVDTTTLQDIYRNNREILNEVEVAIFNADFDLSYHDAVDIDFVKESPEMLERISEEGLLRFYQQEWQVVGLKYWYEGKPYLLTAAALDHYGYSKLKDQLHTSIVVFILSVVLIYFFGRYFSRKAFEPVKEMTAKAKRISATNLDLRINSPGKDELSELANTFDEMLTRLENSFDAQRHFVSNISHELRTPLSAIIAELELSTNKERSIQEYKETIKNALGDSEKLVRLSNSLLDLAKASYDPSEIAFKNVRVDEILIDARQDVKRRNSDFKMNVFFESEFECDHQISVLGNEYLLKVAFSNLIENGCKFSADRKIDVFMDFDQSSIVIKFADKGIGIAEEDIARIFTPFFRGRNKQFADGNGIGLSLTHKIINLHKGTIAVNSTGATGTVFTVTLPHR